MAKPNGIITPKEAKELCDRWMKTRGPAVDRAAHKKDNCSCWWSLQDLRDYLDYAEKQAKELGYTMDGVRVYLGAYGDEAPTDAGYTTMFLAPTGVQKGVIGGANLKSGDITGGNLLNRGQGGHPPNGGYPQG